MSKALKIFGLSLLLVFFVSFMATAVQIEDLPEDKTLIIGVESGPSQLDPHMTTDYADLRIADYGHDALVRFDYDYQTIKGNLAESWEVSECGEIYTFYLKEGVTFHSGREFTSEDVKYSFERWLADETASPSADRVAMIEEIETDGDYKVIFKLDSPSNVFLSNLARRFAVILDKEAVEEAGDEYGADSYQGTGPFKFKDWAHDEHLILKRHDDYSWGAEFFDNTGPSHFEYVVIKILPEAGTLLMEFELGNIDLVVPDAIPGRDVDRLKEHDEVTIELYDAFNLDYIGLDAEHEILGDIKVRRALNHAINKQEIVDSVFFGYALPAKGPIHPVLPGYWEEIEEVYYEFDPEKANMLLEEAGWEMDSDGYRYKDGERFEISLKYGHMEDYDIGMALVQSHLADVGVDLEIIPMDWGGFFDAINRGVHDTYILGFFNPNAYDLLWSHFHSKRIPHPNRFNFSNPRVDELLDKGEDEPDEDKFLSYLEEIQEIIHEEAIWIPMYHKQGWVGVNRDIENFKPHMIYGFGLSIPLDYRK